MGVGEFPAICSEAVDARGFDFRRAVAAEIAVAEVVGEDEEIRKARM